MFKKTFREGFTLVELSLSMVFIGVLSVLVVFIINNTVSAYRRGLTLGQVNTTGMEIVDDMRAAVQNSSVNVLANVCEKNFGDDDNERKDCEDNGAYNFVSVTRTSNNMKINNGEPEEVPIYGAFCTGRYSYIWNSGYFKAENASFDEKNAGWAQLRYKDVDGNIQEINEWFKLLKVEDKTMAVCGSAMANGKYDVSWNRDGSSVFVFDISDGDPLMDAPEEILAADNSSSLAIYDIEVAEPVRNSSNTNAFYSVSFILGTMNGGINIMARGNSCAAPADYEEGNFAYCAINKFSFAVQVNGGEI